MRGIRFSRPTTCKSTTLAIGVAGLVVSMVLSVSNAYAQAGADATMAQAGAAGVSGPFFAENGRVSALTGAPPVNIRRSLATLDFGAAVVSAVKQTRAFRPPVRSQRRSTGRKVVGAVLGAAGGFFAGGFIGAKMEGDCGCDDPGLKGFLIGAPIGAVIGGIFGAKFL